LTEQEQHNEIRELLRKLDNVKASDDFEKKLNFKIIEEEHRRREEHVHRYGGGIIDFFQQLLSGKSYPWLVPATGFVALLFVVLYFVYNSRINTDQITANDSAVNRQEQTSQNAPPLDLAQNETSETQKDQSKEKSVPEFTTEGSTDSKPGTGRVENVPQNRADNVKTNEPQLESKETKEPVKNDISNATEELRVEEKQMQKAPEATETGVQPSSAENNADGMMKSESKTFTAPTIDETKKDKTDSAKSSLSKKLEKLNKKWLEEIEEKINDK
jgi:hypothetical protein